MKNEKSFISTITNSIIFANDKIKQTMVLKRIEILTLDLMKSFENSSISNILKSRNKNKKINKIKYLILLDL
jgi:hypothetical protein